MHYIVNQIVCNFILYAFTAINHLLNRRCLFENNQINSNLGRKFLVVTKLHFIYRNCDYTSCTTIQFALICQSRDKSLRTCSVWFCGLLFILQRVFRISKMHLNSLSDFESERVTCLDAARYCQGKAKSKELWNVWAVLARCFTFSTRICRADGIKC